jgi:hypothetical protein
MIFDDLGLPKVQGADDKMDSAMLAGVMATFSYPTFPKEICCKYIIQTGLGEFQAVRHPVESPANNPKNFSRDQLVCLATGLYFAGRIDLCTILYVNAKNNGWRAQNVESDVPGSAKKFPDGSDWLSPSVRNHLRICAGAKPSLIGKAMFFIDLLWACFVDSKHETNQLICMAMVTHPWHMRFLRKFHKDLKANIINYWCNWRKENALANVIINKVWGM